MNTICNKQKLQEAIQNVSRAVSAKSSLSVLEGILLTAAPGRLTLTGYDLDLGISTTIEAQVEEEGSLVLAANIFGDMVRKMPAEEVLIQSNERMLTTVKSGISEFTILAQDAADFPELPQVEEENTLTLPQDVLKSMIHQTIYAVATNDSKPVHTGTLFDVEEETLTLVSVDGARLAIRKEPLKSGLAASFVVPRKTLAEVEKLLKEEAEAPVELAASKNHVVFKIEDYLVISRLLTGEFLNYRSAIPTGGETAVTVSPRRFLESIERTSLLISDRLRSPARLTFEEDLIRIVCTSAIGKAYDEVPCKIEGPAVQIGFNSRYLQEALKACTEDEVRLELGGPLSPMTIRPPQGDSYLFLVLPVRLKNEA